MTMMAIEPNEDGEIVRHGAPSSLSRGDVESQLDAAHKYPRSIKRVLAEAISVATLSEDIAARCIYTVPRGGKALTGPSIRLAEIMSSAWGNLQVGSRVVEVTDTEVVAQGVAWDMEKNLRAMVEQRRSIVGRSGQRFNDDMISVTGAAACSIALRNAIFRVVPRAYVEKVYEAARDVSVGKATTIGEKRSKLFTRFAQLGITPDRVLARIGKPSVDDVDLSDIEVLIGLGTAIKDGGTTIEEAFPEPRTETPATPAEDGKRMDLKGKRKTEPKAEPEPEVPPAREPGDEGLAMAEGLNRVMLFGNLGADPEYRTTSSGTGVLKLRLATTERYKDNAGAWQDRTEWHRVTVWGKRGEALSRILAKGSTIFVEGSLRTTSYDDKDGVKRYTTEISATNVLLGGRGDSGGRGGERPAQRAADDAPADSFGYGGPSEDDPLPF